MCVCRVFVDVYSDNNQQKASYFRIKDEEEEEEVEVVVGLLLLGVSVQCSSQSLPPQPSTVLTHCGPPGLFLFSEIFSSLSSPLSNIVWWLTVWMSACLRVWMIVKCTFSFLLWFGRERDAPDNEHFIFPGNFPPGDTIRRWWCLMTGSLRLVKTSERWHQHQHCSVSSGPGTRWR